MKRISLLLIMYVVGIPPALTIAWLFGLSFFFVYALWALWFSGFALTAERRLRRRTTKQLIRVRSELREANRAVNFYRTRAEQVSLLESQLSVLNSDIDSLRRHLDDATNRLAEIGVNGDLQRRYMWSAARLAAKYSTSIAYLVGELDEATRRFAANPNDPSLLAKWEDAEGRLRLGMESLEGGDEHGELLRLVTTHPLSGTIQ